MILYLTVPELADRLRISKSAAYDLASERRIPVVHFGKSVRIPLRDLETWERARVQEPRH